MAITISDVFKQPLWVVLALVFWPNVVRFFTSITPLVVFPVFFSYLLLVYFASITRYGIPPLGVYERCLDCMAPPDASVFLRGLAMALSFIRGRQKAELYEFAKKHAELESCVQRYKSLAETADKLTQESCVGPLDEGKQCLPTKSAEELEGVPRDVHELAQALETYRAATSGNIWITQWLATYQERHEGSARAACARRLGCCAADCGCCDKPRKVQDRTDFRLGSQAGRLFLQMVWGKRAAYRAHCSVGCGCCIRCRGVEIAGGTEEQRLIDGDVEDPSDLPCEMLACLIIWLVLGALGIMFKKIFARRLAWPLK